MHKVEYRTRQARHLLAKLVHDKMPMERTPCDPEGPTECGWMAASKAPQRCPGLAPLKAPPSRNTENGEVRIKKASKSSTIADLMSGVQKQKKTDSRAMYKFPSIDAYDFDKSSSPEKSKIVPESNASTATKTNKTMPLTAAQGVTQSNSTANLIKTIFGQTPACSDPGPSKISQDPTSKPQTHLFSKPRAEEAGNVQGVSSMSTTSRAAISTPSTVTSPPASQSYSKSYSWALEDHVTFPSFE